MSDVTPSTESGRLRFEMRHLLGAGSFGEVYLATMASTGGIRQDVAVKILNTDLDPRSQPVERLRDEGRILGALNHPVILQVRDLVILKGRVGLVTEYVPGADLARLLDVGGPVPPRVALQIVGHVADALDAAWNATASDGAPLRLVHRDIKPANLRITPHGTVKLLDFGIAKAQSPERETATTHTVLIGSLPYMAPEVVHMDVEEADMARDVFSLGCTLFEALTGELWFKDLRRAELRRHTARPERYETWRLARIATLPPGLPPALHHLLEQMLAYEAGVRPTARQVADRAHELAEETPGAPLRRWARDFPWPDEELESGVWTGKRVAETTLMTAVDDPLRDLDEIDEPVTVDPSVSADALDAPPVPRLPQPTPAEPAVFVAGTLSPPPSDVSGPPTIDAAVAGRSVLPTSPSTPRSALGRWVAAAVLLGFAGVALGLLTLAAPDPDPVPIVPATTAMPVSAATAATQPAPPAQSESESESPPPAPTPVAKRTPVEPPARHHDPAPREAAPVAPARPSVEAIPIVTVTKGFLQVEHKSTDRVELRSGTLVVQPGEVRAASWEVWADFGDGMQQRTVVDVGAGAKVVVKCSHTLRTCERR